MGGALVVGALQPGLQVTRADLAGLYASAASRRCTAMMELWWLRRASFLLIPELMMALAQTDSCDLVSGRSDSVFIMSYHVGGPTGKVRSLTHIQVGLVVHAEHKAFAYLTYSGLGRNASCAVARRPLLLPDNRPARVRPPRRCSEQLWAEPVPRA